MTAENVEKVVEETNLMDLRDQLPYQYASIIATRLAKRDIDPKITSQQVRLVFYEQITDPTIVLPVLEEAGRLYEDVKKVKTLKTTKL